jgi:hypothetical protein
MHLNYTRFANSEKDPHFPRYSKFWRDQAWHYIPNFRKKYDPIFNEVTNQLWNNNLIDIRRARPACSDETYFPEGYLESVTYHFLTHLIEAIL